jgi:predicted nuclease of predicted toxin-antitoxin system
VRLLFDENLSPRLANQVDALFPGSQHVGSVGLTGKSDQEIWDYAAAHGFIIVSKDNDFRQRCFVTGQPPKVIWLSVGNAGTSAIRTLLEGAHHAVAEFAGNADEALLVLGSKGLTAG